MKDTNLVPRFAWTGGATPREFIMRLNTAVDCGYEVYHMHHHPPFLGAVLVKWVEPSQEEAEEPKKHDFQLLTFPKEE